MVHFMHPTGEEISPPARTHWRTHGAGPSFSGPPFFFSFLRGRGVSLLQHDGFASRLRTCPRGSKSCRRWGLVRAGLTPARVGHGDCFAISDPRGFAAVGKGFPDGSCARPDLSRPAPGLRADAGLSLVEGRQISRRMVGEGPGQGAPADRRPAVRLVPCRERGGSPPAPPPGRGARPEEAGLGGRRLDDHDDRPGRRPEDVPGPRHLLCPPGLQLGRPSRRGEGPADRPGPGRAGVVAQPDRLGQGGRRGWRSSTAA